MLRWLAMCAYLIHSNTGAAHYHRAKSPFQTSVLEAPPPRWSSSFQKVVDAAKRRLATQYGFASAEIAQLNALVLDATAMMTPPNNLLSGDELNITVHTQGLPEDRELQVMAAGLMLAGTRKIRRLEALLPGQPWYHRFQEAAASPETIFRDVPCTSTADCDRLNKLINACSDAKSVAYNIYGTYNQITLVLNQVMAVLCACIFIGPAHICALRRFPYTCVFPYQAFSTFLTGSSSVWEVAKTLTSLCRMHGDPRLIPGIG